MKKGEGGKHKGPSLSEKNDQYPGKAKGPKHAGYNEGSNIERATKRTGSKTNQDY